MKRLALLVAVAALGLSGCAKGDPCDGFNRTFDELQQRAAASSAALIKKGGVCHTRVESQRKAKCPEYTVWLTDATNFANFVATDKSTCTNPTDRENAVADLKTLAKPGAFPQQ